VREGAISIMLVIIIIIIIIITTTIITTITTTSRLIQTAIAQAIIIIIAITQCIGSNFLSAFSNTLALLSLTPSLLWLLWAASLHFADMHSLPLTFDACNATLVQHDAPCDTDWAALVSWCIWLYNGYLAVGSLAGEIIAPEKVIPRVVAVVTPMVVLLYIMPVLVGWAQDPDPQHFQDGHYATLAGVQGGQWLAVAMVGGLLRDLSASHVTRDT